MMRAVEPVPNSARIAELWARFKAELDTRLDKRDIAADEEVAEMLNEVFGSSDSGTPAAVPQTAADVEAPETLCEIFGVSRVNIE